MIRINLLPHRAEKRKARQIQFYALSVISLVLAAMFVGIVHAVITTQIEYQERRNQYLKDQIVLLDKQIAEIKRLKMEIAALMERKTVVEKLQSTRSDVVHLLDQMLNIMPKSVYLKSIKQTGNKINLVGLTQSNARVSTLMRSIDGSQWLESPTLVQISAISTKDNGPRLNEFNLKFDLTTQVPTIPAAPAQSAGTKG
ncbi:MAG: PilN domain-containing protein [Candidatus Nitrotoga sp.]|uniref:PilN domain-containing protein n=1 Tax=Candidatus Nitrotoga sp. BS TaxID=2890408 RepID=UPI001EF17B0F|nr:PilN domain-containing protein [Candidatus Nitrotoga sp. BS]CAH1199758.1 Type IV pilus biogenesis protein PilN [Candidatus Nitrotoga sp. BS]